MSFLFVVVVMPLVIIRNDLEIALLQFQMSFKLWIVYRFHLIIFVSVVWKNYLYTYIYWSSQTTIQIHLWPGNLFRKVKKVSGFSSGNKKNHVFTRDLLAAFPKKKIFFRWHCEEPKEMNLLVCQETKMSNLTRLCHVLVARGSNFIHFIRRCHKAKCTKNGKISAIYKVQNDIIGHFKFKRFYFCEIDL